MTAEAQRILAAEARAFGKQASQDTARSIAHIDGPVELAWLVRISIPFSYVSSKNSTHGYRGKRDRGEKAKFLLPEARKYRDSIALMLKSSINTSETVKIKNHKVWIDIHVEKPNHYGDAVNVVDTVCDAIKMAIPVDDRWYSIRRLDWSINKADPHLYIGIGQEAGVEDSKVCRFCGLIKPFQSFTKDKNSKDGHGGECKSCRLRVSEEDLAANPDRRTWR